MRAWVTMIAVVATSACSKAETATPEPAASGSAASASASLSTVDPNWDKGSGAPQRVAIRVSKDGFEPEVAEFVQGRPAYLDFTRIDEARCGNAIRMPWMSKAVDLPLNELVSIQIPDTSQDGEFQYSCWMKMLFGKVVIKPKPGSAKPDSAKPGSAKPSKSGG